MNCITRICRFVLCALFASSCASTTQWQYVGPQGIPDWDQARAFCYGQVGQPPPVVSDTTQMLFYVSRHNACMRGQGWALVEVQ